MKNILITLFAITTFIINSAFAADMKFVQVDGVRFSPDSEAQTKSFENLISKINNEKDIEFVFFSGNNIAKPDEKYLKDFLKIAKKLNKPYYITLGNKDVNKRKGLGKDAYVKMTRKNIRSMKKVKSPNYYFEKNGVVFVIADGSKEVISLQSGYYRPNVTEWLNITLNEKQNKNVIILQHFPLIPPAQKEDYYTFKADEYLKMLSFHKNVKAVISGHFNVNNEIENNGIMHISTAEAPQYRIIEIIDYDTEKPTFWTTLKE